MISTDHTAGDWTSFALLLIDVQNDFWSGSLAQHFPEFSGQTAQLLRFCRAEGITVIHIRAIFNQDRSDWMNRYRLGNKIPCIAGTPGAEVLSCATELPGEKVIIKQSFDAFLNSELLSHLQQTNKHFLLIAGLKTSTCVLFTSASAMQHGFLTAIVEDCCADKPSRHEYTLNTYPFIFDRTQVALLSTHYEQWMADLRLL